MIITVVSVPLNEWDGRRCRGYGGDQKISKVKSTGKVFVRKSLLFLTVIALSACVTGQPTSKEFLVAPRIRVEVDSATHVEGQLAYGQMDVDMTEDDTNSVSSFDTTAEVPIMTMSWVQGDTAHILGFAGVFVGFGFQLQLVGDHYTVAYYTKTDDWPIYKLNRSDTALYLSLSVPCTAENITLVRKPVYRDGEELAGIVDITSQDFYTAIDGKETKNKVRVRAYFKAVLNSPESIGR